MILLAIAVGLGLYQKLARPYWIGVGIAVLSHLAAQFLFAAGGTIESPVGDGLVTAAIRRASRDGAGVLVVAPFALGLGWVLPLWLVRRGYVAAKATIRPSEAAEW